MHETAAKRQLVRSMNEADVIAQCVAVGMVLIVVNIVAGKSESSSDAEARKGRSIPTICLDSDITIREVLSSDAPDVHDICRYAKRVYHARADQVGLAQRKRSRHAIQPRRDVQYIVRGERI